MIPIYATIGLFKQPKFLNTTHIDDPKRTWLASHLVPFGARFVAERLSCTAEEGRNAEGTYVRILVSGQVQPLEFCGSGNGLCKLEYFVISQGYAKDNGRGDFERCFDNGSSV